MYDILPNLSQDRDNGWLVVRETEDLSSSRKALSSSQKNWVHGVAYLLETGILAVYLQLSLPRVY